MDQNKESANFFSRLLKFFASLRLTVVILLSLAATSIIGTVIPQNEAPAAYISKYGESLYKVFSFLDVFDMYHSWWFQFLLIALTVNVIVCSVNRLSGTWKIVFTKTPSFNIKRFRKLSNKEEFNDNRSAETLKSIYEPIISKNFGYSKVEQTESGFCIFAEKGRWSRLGVYTVHFSVILLLIGGLIGSFFGFSGYVNIPEGEETRIIRLRNTEKMHRLDFDVRCDSFSVSFYDTGAPKKYRSTLSIIEEGNSVLTKDVIVNDPLRYKGINIFQSNYGTLPSKEVTLSFTNRKTEKKYKIETVVRQAFDIPESAGKFVVENYQSACNFRGHNIGEAFVGILTPTDGKPIEIKLPLRYPSFDNMRKGAWIVSVENHKSRYYTGLQVTNDPGVWIVYTGFIVIIIGCFVTFFASHQRLCVEMSKKGSKTSVMVTGSANKNKMGMQSVVKKISQRLKKTT